MNPEFDIEGRTGSARTSPKDLLGRDDLSREDKVEMLRQWELDLREGMVAEEENMIGPELSAVTLDQVLDALRTLGAESQFQNVSTKHG